tara:strand:- start:6836 stop:7609 length:774 start_codon:yes stop_codon:yes gene_type:complete
MSQNKVKLSQVVADFIVTLDGDDYASNASDIAINNFALRGIREIGFDLGRKVRSLKLSIQSNNTVTIPSDFVDMVKIGIVDSNGVIRVMGENKNLNYSQEINSDGDRVDSKGATSDSTAGSSSDYPYVFDNYVFAGGTGALYGLGGGARIADYRINLDQNRIEIEADSGYSQVVLEYVADEARSSDPEVHVYAEEALRSYMYYKIIERKSSVPAAEKARARQEYYNERRKANARISSFTKDEALRTIRKNFKQVPKY